MWRVPASARLIGLLFWAWLLAPLPVCAEARGFSVQGRLTPDGGAQRDGTGYSIRFEIFTEADGGIKEWRETVHNVGIRKGVFQVVLGENPDPESPKTNIAEVFDVDPRFLEITVLSGPGLSRPETLHPRVQLLAVFFKTDSERAREPAGAPAGSSPGGGPAKGKVIEVYPEGNTTKTVVESRGALISGGTVFVGENDRPLVVDKLYSQSEELYYYGASIAGKTDIRQGDEVRIAPKETYLPKPALMAVASYTRAIENNKLAAEVTAVQGKLAMIDRGTLHKVHERDIYRVFDRSGKSRGLLEIGGIGDLQSSGRLYNPFEEPGGDAFASQTGDKAVFVGQRKLFALGLVGGVRSGTEKVLGKNEENFGAGLLWNVTSRDGWGLEILFGLYSRQVQGFIVTQFTEGSFAGFPKYLFNTERDERSALYIAPTWLKKNFFHTSPLSPFLAAGFSLFHGKHAYVVETVRSGRKFGTNVITRRTSVVPVLGAGIEAFPIKFLRLRLDVRYFAGPRLEAGHSAFYARSMFYSAGLATGW